MSFSASEFFRDTLLARFRRRSVAQMAALCHRTTKRGTEILLITSSRGRWILPKGWPIDGLNGAETALQEAWEEAGVKRGRATAEPVATLRGVKRYNDGRTVPCKTSVYGVEVSDLREKFPEASRRKRRWVSVAKAQELVDDPALAKVIGQV